MNDSKRVYDCIVVGGGAAGLCLGYHLARRSPACELLILERREQYADDRSWCFWRRPDVRSWLDKIVSKVWWNWEISSGDELVCHHAERWPYCYVRSSDFYLEACQEIARAKHVTLKKGTLVASIDQLSDCCRVLTDQGEYTAKYVIDSCSTSHNPNKENGLLQIFVGREIQSDECLFNRERAALMKNITASDHEVGFQYILPFNENRGLVEQTVFAKSNVEFKHLELRLEHSIRQFAGGHAISTLRKEQGLIPMGFVKSTRSAGSRIFQAGLAGGAARPSTGYALQRIDRWAKVCAARLASGKPPCDAYIGSYLERSLDRIFLRTLSENLQMAPELFLRMATGTSGDQFAAFLSGSSDPRVLYPVISEMPKRHFLVAATQELVG